MVRPGAFARRAPPRPTRVPDMQVTDVMLGVLVAAATIGGSAVAVVSTATSVHAESSSVLRPGEVAVAIRPVMAPAPNSTSIDSGGGVPDGERGVGTQLPAGGVPPTVAPASTAVPPRPADAPPPAPADARPEPPRGGIRGLPRLAPPTAPTLHSLDDDAGSSPPGIGPGGPSVAPGRGDPETSPADPYAYVDPASEHPDAPPGSGLVTDDVVGEGPGGPGDPLAARAVVLYRQWLQRWLAPHFSVRGSGLPRATLRRTQIRAELEIAADRTVVGYALTSSGPAEVEAAARRALEAVEGSQVPAPPEHYPGPLQRFVRVTFVCSEETCD